jgi:thiol-disulfide isomerase/thioredoxin
LSRGRLIYQANCANCHGPEGHGDGPSAATLKPLPRDFADEWKYGSSKDAIHRVIVQGIPGTAMPASGATLSARDLEAVAAFVQTLGPAAHPIEKMPVATANLFRQADFIPASDLRSAPELQLRDAKSGKEVHSRPRGKLVLLNFWGVACPHCLKEFPNLEALAKQLEGPNFEVLCICADESDSAIVEELARHYTRELPVYVDPRGLTRLRYGVQALPTIVLVDEQGRLLGRSQGVPDWTGNDVSALLTGCLNDLRHRSTQPEKME